MDFFKLSKIKRPGEGKMKHAGLRFFYSKNKKILKENTKFNVITITKLYSVRN